MAQHGVMMAPETGRTRVAFDPGDRDRLIDQGLLVEDGRRTRSSFFNGRFLSARDLTREQTYVLSRMADLGRASGAGIVTGLSVTVEAGMRALTVGAGYGISGSGELVVLTDDVQVDLANLAEIENLNAIFGLGRAPNAPPWTLTGAFIVALRPVEYTANPTEAYPTSVTGTRRLEDGDVIEATAVVLFPYPLDLGGGLERARARIAHDLFVAGRPVPMAPGVLPLAIVMLNGGAVSWVDEFLVRREVGADHGGIRGLGSVDLAQREAYLAQYDRHLQAEGTGAYAAGDRFLALPPAGRMPAATVFTDTLTQSFFPPSVDVRLSIVPDDEVAALVEEGRLLPPIDLTRPAAELEGTAVLVLVPTPRWQVRALTTRLDTLQRPLQPAVNQVAAFRPAFSLNVLLGRVPRLNDAADPESQVWKETLGTIAAGAYLWYVRRPNLASSEEVAGVDLMLIGDTATTQAALEAKLVELGFGADDTTGVREQYQNIIAQTSGDTGLASLTLSFLASVSFEDSPTLIAGAINDLNREFATAVSRDQVLATWGRYVGAGFGEGVIRIEGSSVELRTAQSAAVIGMTGRVPDLDRVGRISARPLTELAQELSEAIAAGGDAVSAWIDAQLNGGG